VLDLQTVELEQAAGRWVLRLGDELADHLEDRR
jgi:hypothetical protein